MVSFNREIKDLIDASVDQKDASGNLKIDVQMDCVETCVGKMYPHILGDYQLSHDCIQFVIDQLERMHYVAVLKMLLMAFDKIGKNAYKFLKEPSFAMSYYKKTIDEKSLADILNKIDACLGGQLVISELKLEIAQILTTEQRKELVGYCLENMGQFSLKVEEDKSALNRLVASIIAMYSICKTDCVLELFFNSYYVALDVLVKSSRYQVSRDFAESLLIIGHQEKLIAEAYLGAARVYTSANHVLAGLLYLNIALDDLSHRESVSQNLAFEIIWQMLKTMKEMNFTKSVYLDKLLYIYNALGMGDYDTLKIYCTAFAIGIKANADVMAGRIERFLNEKKELIFNTMSNSAEPWYTLFKSIQNCGVVTSDYPTMLYMEKIMKRFLVDSGNRKWVDFFESEKKHVNLLKEELAKIQETRNSEDVGNDSHKAMMMATHVLNVAYEDKNTENFILAMRPKADFSFAMSNRELVGLYKKIELEEIKGENCMLEYAKTEVLPKLLTIDEGDRVMWIGRGTKHVFKMTLMGNGYDFDCLRSFETVDVNKVQKEIISQLNFERKGRDACGFYDKDNNELMRENNQIRKQLDNCRVPILGNTKRLFFIKDMELSAIPHQLMIDEKTGKFIGEIGPSANVISTEFFIKSNFDNPLPKKYSKSYWSPVNREQEVTFYRVKDKLNSIFDDYRFNVDESDEPAKPLCFDLNIVCAHGAENICNTEWFYAGGEPIVNTQKIIGQGKILLLFVCYSGRITHQFYDHSMHTIVKRYLKMGYSSVVAPMWSLNTDILPIWLDTFMRIIDDGGYVVDAVFQANMKVKEEFISSSAWACLHLFGNPYMRIADKPRLYISED
ncbi:hypothetical protein IKQ19_17425 [Candidatus Saccharibacteria bacterium]|nr:hypothetical protein [Candidatus Saccharibacteria bacterium]MBR6125343.1 hypothetical protein [Candidatus Saccharibacteria bacterium]